MTRGSADFMTNEMAKPSPIPHTSHPSPYTWDPNQAWMTHQHLHWHTRGGRRGAQSPKPEFLNFERSLFTHRSPLLYLTGSNPATGAQRSSNSQPDDFLSCGLTYLHNSHTQTYKLKLWTKSRTTNPFIVSPHSAISAKLP